MYPKCVNNIYIELFITFSKKYTFQLILFLAILVISNFVLKFQFTVLNKNSLFLIDVNKSVCVPTVQVKQITIMIILLREKKRNKEFEISKYF